MRKYLFGTGILPAFMGGLTLMRGLRSDDRFTWRTALALLNWGISLALAIGTIVDTRRATVGRPVASDSPVAGNAQKLYKKGLRS